MTADHADQKHTSCVKRDFPKRVRSGYFATVQARTDDTLTPGINVAVVSALSSTLPVEPPPPHTPQLPVVSPAGGATKPLPLPSVTHFSHQPPVSFESEPLHVRDEGGPAAAAGGRPRHLLPFCLLPSFTHFNGCTRKFEKCFSLVF